MNIDLSVLPEPIKVVTVIMLCVFLGLCVLTGICCLILGSIKDKEMVEMERRECVIRSEYFEKEWGVL